MPGTLYVVATPIGNLEDITLRGLRVLREVSVIAAEDTRRTSRLLTHHSIGTGTVSFHQHNTKARLPGLLSRLTKGDDVALVTDAGTPGVSDPGLELIQACIESGLSVEPIPGVSAPLVALVGSGFALIPFTIFGFVPNRSSARIRWLSEVGATPHTFSFFETPHRLKLTLRAAADIFGTRPICVARELTKLHEEFIRGTAADLSGQVIDPRGEFTVVVGPRLPDQQGPRKMPDSDLAAIFWHITETRGGTRREIVKTVAAQAGVSQRDVYAAVERAKKYGI